MAEGEDVSFFVLAIVDPVLLDRIIGQMHEQVVDLVEVVLLPRHANVSLFEEVATVLRCDHDPEPDVEFSLIDQQRPLDVLLQDKHVRLDT